MAQCCKRIQKYIKIYKIISITSKFHNLFQSEVRSYFRNKRKIVILKIKFQSNSLKRMNPLKARPTDCPELKEGSSNSRLKKYDL